MSPHLYAIMRVAMLLIYVINIAFCLMLLNFQITLKHYGIDHIVVRTTSTYTVPITTKDMSFIPANG